MKRIGILGGTFDPPHIGHLIIAQEVRESLNLDEIWFIPSSEPPHKQSASASAIDRLTMVEKAISDEPLFLLNTIEIERKGKSYTYDTIIQLIKMNPGMEFFFIIGADMVEYLPKWYKIDELCQLVTFVGVNRPGFTLDTPYPIVMVDVPFIEISSSMLRKRIAQNKSIKYFVNRQVQAYIEEGALYE